MIHRLTNGTLVVNPYITLNSGTYLKHNKKKKKISKDSLKKKKKNDSKHVE